MFTQYVGLDLDIVFSIFLSKKHNLKDLNRQTLFDNQNEMSRFM